MNESMLKPAGRLISAKRMSGLSLIEVLVALLVLSIGLLGLAALQTFSLQGSQNSYYRTLATSLAYEVSDFARVNRSVMLGPSCGTADLVDLLPDVSLGGNSWERFLEQFPAGTLTAVMTDCNAGEITITVGWAESRLADAVGGAESVVVVTRI